jgi:hypothetical protein
MHATLTGANHTPTIKKKWIYTVMATDAHGHPLTGTVLTEFVFNGSVVGKETPATHKLKHGVLRDWLKFPPQSLGIPLQVQVVVTTSLGSKTLDWAIKTQK